MHTLMKSKRFNRKRVAIGLVELWSLALVFGSHAADRVALVIGNSAYQHASKLANATNDSAAIARLLKSAGFTLVTSPNGDSGGISDASTEEFYGVIEGFKKAAALEVILVNGSKPSFEPKTQATDAVPSAPVLSKP